MNTHNEILFEVDGVPFSHSQLAVLPPGEGFSDPGLLAQSPDGMVVRLHLDTGENEIIGRLKIPLRIFLPAAEKVYEIIKSENESPSDAYAVLVEDEYGNVWPPLDEMLKDSELWIDAFENYLFPLVRLVIPSPNYETRYLVKAVSSNCDITEDGLELRLLLETVRSDSPDTG